MRPTVRAAFAAALLGCFTCVVYAASRAPEAHAATGGLATSAGAVIDRNVAARGGLEAWRKVDSMMWFGHLDRAGKSDVQHVPFVMQLGRPNRTRFEIKERYSQFTRVFDGDHGWRIRPGNTGQPDMKSFSKEEVNYASAEFPLDGPLIDYQAKGITAGLDGIDTVDGRQAYRLSLRLASGAPRKIWIDVHTNLEIRYDRPATNPLAPGKPVSLYYGEYTVVDGLTVPKRLTVRSGDSAAVRETGDTLVIDRVMINPKLDSQAFLPPPTPMRRGGKILIPSDGTPVGAMGRTGP